MEILKLCSGCKQQLPRAAFQICRSKKSGLQSFCRDCSNRKAREWKLAHPNQHKATNKKWQSANKHRHYLTTKAFLERMGKAWAVKAARKHAMKYPDRVNRRTKEYQAKKLNAIPTWNERFIVEEAYELAERRSKAFGFKWHVDHIVPIQSPIVCGLHVHSNLQVIPGADNIRKGNLYWPDMP